MHSSLFELRRALRFLGHRRAAAAVLIATMALVIGANTAVFSVLQALLFNSLAVPAADRVMFVWTVRHLDGRGAVNFFDAYPNVRLLRATTHFWESLAATLGADLNWQHPDGETTRLTGARVEAEFFSVMGARPVFGRVFTAAEQGPQAAPVAVISDALWRQAFDRSPEAIGRMLRLNGVLHTVIGVLPRGFQQPQGTDVWVPFDLPENSWNLVIGGRQLGVYARLRPGVTPADAREELRAFAPRAIEANPENKDWSWTVQPLREALLAGADSVLLLAQAGAGILLVLGICNLTSLLLAWAVEREHETALQLALGASGWHLFRQFLTLSLLLVATGGALGVAGAEIALPLFRRLNPNPVLAAFLSDLHLEVGALGFGTALVLGTALVAGLFPVVHLRKTSLMAALKAETRGTTPGRSGLPWQQSLVVTQAAVAVFLLTGATLSSLGFIRLARVEPGFRCDHRVVFRIQFPEPAFSAHERRAAFVRELEQHLAQEPAIKSFGFTTTIPVGDIQRGGGFHPQLPSSEFLREPQVFHFRRVSPGYLATLGVPLLEGRMLEARDRATSPHVALISRAAASRYWPGESPLGRKLRRAVPKDAPLIEIVGVVGNVRDAGAGAPDAETIYVPFDQISLQHGWVLLQGDNPAALFTAGRQALRATNRAVAFYNAALLADLAWQANALPRLQMVLLGFFALLAVVLTALGSYGVMSQLVAIRQSELAVRSMLGATRTEVLRLVLWSNARLALVGTGLGLTAAWFVSQWLQAKLTGFDAGQGWPYAVVFALVLGLTQLASYLPARRAARATEAGGLPGA
jgi:putative ABC transport system permease protein